MSIVLRIIGGLIIAAVGFLFAWKTDGVLRTFGAVSWAEQHLGSDGGSRLFYKLLGILFIVIGFLMMTGLLGGILIGVLGPLFGAR